MVEVIQPFAQGRFLDRNAEQPVDAPVPLNQERLAEVVTAIPERFVQRTGKRIVDMLVPQTQVELARVTQLIQQARTSSTLPVRRLRNKLSKSMKPSPRCACHSAQRR